MIRDGPVVAGVSEHHGFLHRPSVVATHETNQAIVAVLAASRMGRVYGLAEALDGSLPPDQWRNALIDMARIANTMGPGAYDPQSADGQGASYERMAKAVYPRARSWLASKGLPAAQLDAVPMDQAVGEFLVWNIRRILKTSGRHGACRIPRRRRFWIAMGIK
jgi:hypothetical protein